MTEFTFFGWTAIKCICKWEFAHLQCDRFQNAVFLLRLVKHRSRTLVKNGCHLSVLLTFFPFLHPSVCSRLSRSLSQSTFPSCLFAFCSQMACGSTAGLKDRRRNQIYSLYVGHPHMPSWHHAIPSGFNSLSSTHIEGHMSTPMSLMTLLVTVNVISKKLYDFTIMSFWRKCV